MQELKWFAEIAVLLLLKFGSAAALNGGETAATATQFPQLVAISSPSGKFYVGAIISSKFVIAPPQLASENREGSRVFSGDLTVLANAPEHRIASLSDVAVGTLVKLCTAIANHSAVSIAAGDNFNFTSDTTGKIMYVNMRAAQKGLYFRTAEVLTDANCVSDVTPFNGTVEYFDPLGTCIKFDNAAQSCVHMVGSASTTFTSYPMLLIDTKSVAMFETGVCNTASAPNTAMTSTHLFTKLKESTSLLLTDAQFDFQ